MNPLTAVPDCILRFSEFIHIPWTELRIYGLGFSSFRRLEMGETIEKRSKVWRETMKAVTIPRMIDESCGTSEDGEECRLLPELPDDITLLEIVPQLDWKTCYLISKVNRSWRKANRNRQVYDARVRSPSTERHFVLSHLDEEGERVISLYSMRDNALRRLPKFPYRQEYDDRGLPDCCTHISLEGKIYVLGGFYWKGGSRGDEDGDMMNVYVLDLAGQREWQQCASMPQRRISFQFGVMDGNIYVFEGSDHGIPIHESVVYDPKAYLWSLTGPMMYDKSLYRVVVLRDEKDEWKVLGRIEHHHMREFFTGQGKLYRIEMDSVRGIFVDNFDGQGNRSTTLLHLFSFLKEGVEVSMEGSLFTQVCPLEDGSGEILVMCVQGNDALLFKSEGFGSSNELLPCLWIDVPFPEFPEPLEVHQDFSNYSV